MTKWNIPLWHTRGSFPGALCSICMEELFTLGHMGNEKRYYLKRVSRRVFTFKCENLIQTDCVRQ